ncbi:hypothetical protein BDW69DRAFT_186252 [Aspergillus filifer]
MATRKPEANHSDLQTEIPTLDQSELVSILTHAAKTYPSIHQKIKDALSARRTRESARVLTFDWMSRSIWHTINRKYSSLSDSKQYDISGEMGDWKIWYRITVDSLKSRGFYHILRVEYRGRKPFASFGC